MNSQQNGVSLFLQVFATSIISSFADKMFLFTMDINDKRDITDNEGPLCQEA